MATLTMARRSAPWNQRNLPNMGLLDRMVRGLLGSALFWNGLTHFNRSPFRRIETLIGGAFVAYSVTGVDPLLAFFGSTTKVGHPDSVMRHLKQAIPGQGVKPYKTGQPRPVNVLPRLEAPTVAETLAVGF